MTLEGADITAANLSERIQRILTHPGLADSMSSGAHKTAQECLDWNRLIDATLQFNDRDPD